MPLDSTPRSLRGCEIHDDHDFAADELFGLVSGGDSGDDLADFVAHVDHNFQQLVGAGHAFGGLHLADAHLHFGEVVDGDAGICACGRGGLRGGRCRRSCCWSGWSLRACLAV